MSYQQLGGAMGQRASLQQPLQTVHFSQQPSPLSPTRSSDSAGMTSIHLPVLPQTVGPPRAAQPHVEISDVRDECLTEYDARKKLSRYIVVRMEKSGDPNANANANGGAAEQDSWGRAVWFIYTHANQQEVRHKVRQLNKGSSKTVADKKSELKTILRCQLDKVREFLQQGDKDCRYEHTLAQLEFESRSGHGGGSGNGSPERSARSRSRSRRSSTARSKSVGRTTGGSSILAYFKRAPKADENCLSIWGEQKHAPLSVLPYQVQHLAGGQQPFQPGMMRTSSHAMLDPTAYVPQFQRLPSHASALHPAAIPAPARLQTSVPMVVGIPNSAGGHTTSAKNRGDQSAQRTSYGSTLSDSSASSHDTAETFTSDSSDDSELRHSRSVKRKEEPRSIHKRVKMAGAEASRDKSHGKADSGSSAFDARDVLHALADCIRVEWTKGGSKHEEQQQQQQQQASSNPGSLGGRSQQSSGHAGAYERAADLGGPLAQAEDGFYHFPRWGPGQAQPSADSSRGQPQFVVRGYLEDQPERQSWMGQPAWRQQQRQQPGRGPGGDWDHQGAYRPAGYDSRQSSHYGGFRGGY